MYVCGWETLKLKDGTTVRRGQPVPEAANWPAHILMSNLRIGAIRQVPDSVTSKGGHGQASAAPVSAPVEVQASAPEPKSKKKR